MLSAGGDAGMHPQLPVRQLMQLGLGNLKDFLLRSCLLQHLVGFEQQVCPVGCPGGLLDLTFQPVGQSADNQRRHNHNKEGHGRAVLVDPQGKPGAGEEEIEHHHTAHCGQNITAPGGGCHGGQQHRQQIDGDDIRFRKAHPGKGVAHHRGKAQNPQRHRPVPQKGRQAAFSSGFLGTVGAVHVGIRDNMDVHVRRHGDELFRQGRLAPGVLPCRRASSDDDFCHSGQPGVLRDLIGHVVAEHRLHRRAQTLRQPDIGPKPLPVGIRHGFIAGRLNKQRRKAAMKGLGHGGGGANDLRVGRR